MTAALPLAAGVRRNAASILPAWTATRITLVVLMLSSNVIVSDLNYYAQGFTPDTHDFEEYPYPAALILNALAHCVHSATSFHILFVVLALVLDALITLALIRHEEATLASRWIIATSLLGAICYTRLDVFVMMALMGVIMTINRSRLSASLIACATAIKFWPITLVMMGWRSRTSYRRITLASALTCIWVGLTIMLCGVDRVLSPINHQSGRGFQNESVIGSLVGVYETLTQTHIVLNLRFGSMEFDDTFAQHWRFIVPFISLIGYLAILTILWSYRTTTITRAHFVRFGMLITLTFIVCSPVLSLQYLTWLVPFIIFTDDKTLRWLGYAALATTQLEGQWMFDNTYTTDARFTHIVYVILIRNLLLIAMMVQLWRSRTQRASH